MATKLKAADMGSFDPEELDVEWEDSDFEAYDGEQPPSGTYLRGYVKKLWWTFTSGDVPMIKVLWVAADNTGKNEEYNGLPIWDNLVFSPKAAFRYGPFLQSVGLTLKDIHGKTYVEDEDDNIGAPITKIAKVVPGEDLEVGVVTKRSKYNGEWRVEVGKYTEPPDEDDDDDDDDDDEPEEKPARGGRRAPAKPAAKAKDAPAKSRRKPEPEPEEDDDDGEDDDDDDVDEDDTDDDDDEDEPEEKPAAKSRRAPSKPAAKSASTARKPAARKPAASKTTRSRKAAADDEDPF